MGIPSYTRNGGAGFHFHFFGGNLGGAIALEMLLDIPIIWGAVLTTLFVSIMLFTNSYKKDRAFHYRIRLGDRAVVYL